ncbi:E3 ubiquitin-protein ligase RMA1H1-like [Punica granatum]|uniref:E3 ubiquitin-protein ligase RMA n=1 Tax=Punica granatum TaxID=22663 RepID=A0A218X0Y5_PUNGR|nr:E3 ubiquitin-protein ligase RMA1H1-like [Punica granatum]XP_031378997.1 E3 ubiquitin-protein ligase RMA1H1-like [Punica granatum]OWM78644.1 hypothetical protein CDL15_Pgr002815 [Punica granatum]
MEHSFRDDIAPHGSEEEWNRRKSFSGAAADTDSNQSTGFDCYICLDPVQDPVVTLCGHLYCWPCIYKWLESQGISSEDKDQPQQCPVCKSEISHNDLIPLYGRGQATINSKTKARQLGIAIPRRPLGPVSGPGAPLRSITAAPTSSLRPTRELHSRGYLPQSQPYISNLGHFPAPAMFGNTTMRVIDPIVGIFGEVVHARIFGNAITNIYTYPNAYHLDSTSPRVRRLMMQANKSLSRICFFLLCCCILCLLLF